MKPCTHNNCQKHCEECQLDKEITMPLRLLRKRDEENFFAGVKCSSVVFVFLALFYVVIVYNYFLIPATRLLR